MKPATNAVAPDHKYGGLSGLAVIDTTYLGHSPCFVHKEHEKLAPSLMIGPLPLNCPLSPWMVIPLPMVSVVELSVNRELAL